MVKKMGREIGMKEEGKNGIGHQKKNENEGINRENGAGIIEKEGVVFNTNDRQDQKKFFENLTWLTSNEAAEYLRLPSVGALRVLVCKRKLPFHKLGRNLRFKRVELDRLLETSKHFGGF